MHWLLTLSILTLCFNTILCSPLSHDKQDIQQESDEDVKELESLIASNNKVNQTNPVQPEETPASSESPKIQPTSVPESVSNSRSAIFRHRGITQAKKNKYWGGKSAPVMETVEGSVLPYAPADLAWYILSTGDEDGVAVVVEELVRIGMVGRTDAINYLQDVKQILNYMKEVRDQLQAKKLEQFANAQAAYSKMPFAQRLAHLPKQPFNPAMSAEKREPEPVPETTPETPQLVTSEEPAKAEIVPEKVEDHPPEAIKEEDTKRTMHTQPPNSYDDFTLEVIYKLAKDMFTQSILRDDPTAEDTLSGLVTFLENKVENRHISPEMKEKVLLVVSGALLEALQEGYQAYNVPSENMSEMYRKLTGEGHDNRSQLTNINARPNAS